MTTPTILILVGITGDLSKRKLLPAITSLKEQGKLPEQFRLVGITRQADISIEGADVFQMDLESAPDYIKLKEHLEAIEKEFGAPAQRLFYLSVASAVALPIVEQLDTAGLSKIVNTKLLLEKPFGTDAENGSMLIKNIDNAFVSEQVYRVDHYLAKDCVRKLAAEHIEKKNLQKIELVAFEEIAIEGRADFYEQTGALRDFVQSHLLEVIATTLVDMPVHTELTATIEPLKAADTRLHVLQQLSIPIDPANGSNYDNVIKYVHRGQYHGYRDNVSNKDSVTETSVVVTLQSNDEALKNVVITLKTGKALAEKVTELRLTYKDEEKVISLDEKYNAYEHVFADAISGNKEFFVSPDEVIENWRILKPIQEAWKTSSEDLKIYKPGSKM
jgi:glucose-6-phosphate 1-dehydrogenase